jgi:RND superfamily putative drug exporter
VLTLLLRALLAPLLLIVTVVFSVAATLGVRGWAFSHLSGFAGADQAIPVVRVRVPRRPGASTTTSS